MLPSNQQTVTGLSGLLSQLFGGVTERGALPTAELSGSSAFGQSLAGQIKSLMIERGDDPEAVATINDEALVAAFLAQAQMPPAPAPAPMPLTAEFAVTATPKQSPTNDKTAALPTTMLERLGEAGRLLAAERVPSVTMPQPTAEPVVVQTAPVTEIAPKPQAAPAPTIASQPIVEPITVQKITPVAEAAPTPTIAPQPTVEPVTVQTAPVAGIAPQRPVAPAPTIASQPIVEPITVQKITPVAEAAPTPTIAPQPTVEPVTVQTAPVAGIAPQRPVAPTPTIAPQPTVEPVTAQTAPVTGIAPQRPAAPTPTPTPTPTIAPQPTVEPVTVQTTPVAGIALQRPAAPAPTIASQPTVEPVAAQTAPVAEIVPKPQAAPAPTIAPQPTVEPITIQTAPVTGIAPQRPAAPAPTIALQPIVEPIAVQTAPVTGIAPQPQAAPTPTIAPQPTVEPVAVQTAPVTGIAPKPQAASAPTIAPQPTVEPVAVQTAPVTGIAPQPSVEAQSMTEPVVMRASQYAQYLQSRAAAGAWTAPLTATSVEPPRETAISELTTQPLVLNHLLQPGGEQHLAEHVHQLIDAGLDRTTIKLDPPSLGTLELRLVQTGTTPQIQLIAAHPVARDVLETVQPQLNATLALDGIETLPIAAEATEIPLFNTPTIQNSVESFSVRSNHITSRRLAPENKPLNLSHLSQPNGEQPLIQHIRQMIDSGQSRAEIKLDPPNLGTLEIRQTQTNGIPQVQISAPNPVARETLNIALPQIRDALAQTGIKLESTPIITQPLDLSRLSQPNGEQPLIQHIRQIIDSGQAHAEIKLDPPNLGTLEIRQTQTNGIPQVQISAPNPVAREALNTALPQIRDALAQTGIKLESTPIITQPLDLSRLSQPNGEQPLIQHIRQIIDSGQARAEIKLEPPNLGTLEIRQTQTNGIPQVQISAPNPVARETLNIALPQIRDALAQTGIKLESTPIINQSLDLSRLSQPNGEQPLIQHIRQMIDSGQARAEIKLDPPNLGTLDIRQTQTNGIPQVQISAQNPVAREALNTALPQIRDALVQTGIKLESTPIINQPLDLSRLSQPNGEQPLIQHIRQIIDSGQARAEIKLEPPNLGTLEIRQTQTNGIPQVQISAPNPVARETLNIALPQIRDALAQTGIKLESTPIITQPLDLSRLSQPSGEQPLIQHIRQIIDSGQARAEIKLDPPDLGTLDIRQTQTNGIPQVQLVASNPVTREALNTALPQIRDALAQTGIKLESTPIITQPLDLSRLSQPNGEQSLIQHIRQIIDSGQARAEIKLDPPDLGTLDIRQTQTNGIPQVQLVASNPVTREALNTALPQIRDALAQTGIKLEPTLIITQPLDLSRLSQPNGEQPLIQHIRQMIDSGEARAEIKLDPPNLGTLDIRQTQTNGIPQVQLVASNPVTREALNTALPQIRDALVQTGIKLESTPIINQPLDLSRLSQLNGEQPLIQQIRQMIDSGQARAEIKLDPPNLGTLEIRQTQTNGIPQVQLVASNPVTREALNTALPQIRDALAQTGIKLESTPIITQPLDLSRLSQPNGEQPLIQHIRQMIDSGQAHAEIKLDPPNLGTLEIRQTQTNGIPQVQISAPNPVARETLNIALPQIRDALAQTGIKLESTPIITQPLDLSRLS
ncbi:hook-length control protein FliK, partial [Allochromatium warmingii]